MAKAYVETVLACLSGTFGDADRHGLAGELRRRVWMEKWIAIIGSSIVTYTCLLTHERFLILTTVLMGGKREVGIEGGANA